MTRDLKFWVDYMIFLKCFFFFESVCNLLSSSDDQGSAYELFIRDMEEMSENGKESPRALEVGAG